MTRADLVQLLQDALDDHHDVESTCEELPGVLLVYDNDGDPWNVIVRHR